MFLRSLFWGFAKSVYFNVRGPRKPILSGSACSIIGWLFVGTALMDEHGRYCEYSWRAFVVATVVFHSIPPFLTSNHQDYSGLALWCMVWEFGVHG